MMALVAGNYLKEEGRLSLKVLGYSINLCPVLGGEGELITPLQQGGECVTELQDLLQTVGHLVVTEWMRKRCIQCTEPVRNSMSCIAIYQKVVKNNYTKVLEVWGVLEKLFKVWLRFNIAGLTEGIVKNS